MSETPRPNTAQEPGYSPLDTNLLLRGARHGDEQAKDKLFAHLYGELQRLARLQLRRAHGQGLQTTELVHEAYLKLCNAERLAAGDRAHFFSIASGAMRQILVDHFRHSSAAKRGGSEKPVTLDEGALSREQDGASVLAIDEALERFATLDERAARVVELKFFGGMTEPEIADALDISIRTISGDWRRARAWLIRELGRGPTTG